MGERKGTNHYYPPDYDPGKGGLNKFLGTHALRERARKLHLGILIIRFEMPYNIWCDGCGNHIGMGVRYNAEKKKVGMYYSTPVYQFRMKCHLCDNHFEIKTDPGNLDYIIVSGARRQENRWDPTENEQVVPEEKATQKRLFDDAMFKLEHGKGDQTTGKSVDHGSRKLIARRDELWQDDFSANSLLRAKYRATKRAANAKDTKDKGLLKKFGLDMKLVPEHESDIKLASLLSLKPSTSIIERLKQTRTDIINRPVLPSSCPIAVKFIPVRNTKSLVDSKPSYDLGITVRRKSIDVQSAYESQTTTQTESYQGKNSTNTTDYADDCEGSGSQTTTQTENYQGKNSTNTTDYADDCEEQTGGDSLPDNEVIDMPCNENSCDGENPKMSLVSCLYNDSSCSD